MIMKKKILNEEFKRMQKLAGILNENTAPSEDIKEYLLGMVQDFNDGNDNEYPEGKKMEFRYEGITFGDYDLEEEDREEFKNVKSYLEQNGPITLNDRIDYTFSTDGEDIIMNWVEPNWDELNGGAL
jgi:hypothetical protein